MILKGIIDYDCVNYKKPVLTLEFPRCDFKCDKLNKCQVCQNSSLAFEPDIEIPFTKIWEMYIENPLTKGFCFQGLEPLYDINETLHFIIFIREVCHCDDPIIIYTGYNQDEATNFLQQINRYKNIIIKWGRFIMNQKPHYDEILGVNLASNNQYAEVINYESTCDI